MPTRPVESVIRGTPLPKPLKLLAIETQDIVIRLRNLMEYMETKTYKELPPLEQCLMVRQRDTLLQYAEALSLRYCMLLLDTAE